MDKLVVQTALRNFLTKLVVAALMWVGAFLLSHGLATEDELRQAVDPVAQILVGGIVSLAGVVVIWVRARLKRVKEEALVAAKRSDVTIKGA